MKKYIIKLNDKVYEVEMEEVTAETSADLLEAAKTTAANSGSTGGTSSKSALGAAPAGGQTIEAPMPGTIVDVAVKSGDIIKKGQLLLVLEAMKMENEIVSPVDGKILSVGVSKGDAVSSGDLLVQIG